MPIPGLSTTYDFVDWLKEARYSIPYGQQVALTGVGGGLVEVTIQNVSKPKET